MSSFNIYRNNKLQGWGGSELLRGTEDQKIFCSTHASNELLKGKMEAQAASTHFGWVGQYPIFPVTVALTVPGCQQQATLPRSFKIDYLLSKFHSTSAQSLLAGSPWMLAARGAIILPRIKGREGTDFLTRASTRIPAKAPELPGPRGDFPLVVFGIGWFSGHQAQLSLIFVYFYVQILFCLGRVLCKLLLFI